MSDRDHIERQAAEVKRLLNGITNALDVEAGAAALDDIGAELVESMEAVRNRAALQAALKEC
jgi:hypothetical protein